MTTTDASPTTSDARIAQLEARLAAAEQERDDARRALEGLRQAYTRALEQLALLRRRLFVAKAERVEACGEQLAFDALFAEVKRLEKALDEAERAEPTEAAAAPSSEGGEAGEPKRRAGGKGRRDLAKTALPVVRVELPDPEFEAKVRAGEAERVGVEESSRLGYERGGMRRIVLERVVYKVPAPKAAGDAPASAGDEAGDEAGDAPAPRATGDAPPRPAPEPPRARFVTAPLPRELGRRPLLAPSLIAHVLVMKYVLGVPFYRLEQQLAREGAPLDRGTMSRYAEDVGATLGALVEAARDDAFATAFCLSTDATGVSIQPGPIAERDAPGRAACRKGHFFVVLADRDHVFFEYQPKHTSAAVCAMFRGFSGYVQADAHAVYDALFRGAPPRGAPPDELRGPPPTEVGCWSHCRRNFWEAAVCKHALGLEGLRRVDAIFAADRPLGDLPPAKRKARRDVLVRPLVDAFFDWVKAEHARPRERGLVASALGYAIRQEGPLRRFLEDGRLRLENNASERALRAIATGRKAWLFFGSDDHAQAAANLFSLVASCKLHVAARAVPRAHAQVLAAHPRPARPRRARPAPGARHGASPAGRGRARPDGLKEPPARRQGCASASVSSITGLHPALTIGVGRERVDVRGEAACGSRPRIHLRARVEGGPRKRERLEAVGIVERSVKVPGVDPTERRGWSVGHASYNVIPAYQGPRIAFLAGEA
ncbi:MAG: IS66 family transposase [Polyangiaceae bacterium]|nr:IS66 family transposase [Polyangiaceae bacterium]